MDRQRPPLSLSKLYTGLLLWKMECEETYVKLPAYFLAFIFLKDDAQFL